MRFKTDDLDLSTRDGVSEAISRARRMAGSQTIKRAYTALYDLLMGFYVSNLSLWEDMSTTQRFVTWRDRYFAMYDHFPDRTPGWSEINEFLALVDEAEQQDEQQAEREMTSVINEFLAFVDTHWPGETAIARTRERLFEEYLRLSKEAAHAAQVGEPFEREEELEALQSWIDADDRAQGGGGSEEPGVTLRQLMEPRTGPEDTAPTRRRVLYAQQAVDDTIHAQLTAYRLRLARWIGELLPFEVGDGPIEGSARNERLHALTALIAEGIGDEDERHQFYQTVNSAAIREQLEREERKTAEAAMDPDEAADAYLHGRCV